MSLAIALYLAAAAAQPSFAKAAEPQLQGAEVAEARIAVQIMRAAVLRDGIIVFNDGKQGPRTQELRREGRVTYEFE